MVKQRKILIAFLFNVLLNLFQVNCAFHNKANNNGLNDEEKPSLPSLPPLGMTPSRFEPYFDTTLPVNVSSVVGKSSYLSCRVRNLGNKTVSWIRHRDMHILTTGTYTYTSDQRFHTSHDLETDEWILTLKWPQKRDSGNYECQISTQPIRSYFVYLHIVVPTASILGGPDMHVDKGSTINLTCCIRFSPEPPAYIFWYHHDDIYAEGGINNGSGRIIALIQNNEVISYDSSRGGVSVITDKGDVTISFLLIQLAELTDSGKYSCSPSNADIASIRVHVLNGEKPAAMQTGSAGLTNNSLNFVILFQLISLWFFWG